MLAPELYSGAVILKRPPLYYKKGRPKSIREKVLVSGKHFKYAMILEKIVLNKFVLEFQKFREL